MVEPRAVIPRLKAGQGRTSMDSMSTDRRDFMKAASVLAMATAASTLGIRFNLVKAGTTTVKMIEPLSKRVNDLGWHIQIHMKGEQIAGIEDLLLRVPSPIVFDHLGRLAQPNALDNPGFKTISKLIDKGKTWVKLSGAYQDSKVGPPSYSDTVPVARAYVKAAPERMVWASDWPHPTEKEKPNDAVLFDLLAEWSPDPATRSAILVQNPATLYGFPPSA